LKFHLSAGFVVIDLVDLKKKINARAKEKRGFSGLFGGWDELKGTMKIEKLKN
jgi:hypothetical protein